MKILYVAHLSLHPSALLIKVPQSYNGGNKQPSEQAAMTDALQTIRQTIFESKTGTIDSTYQPPLRSLIDQNIDIEVLATPGDYYGNHSNSGLFHLSSVCKGSYVASSYLVNEVDASGNVSDYYRWLDMDNGVTRTLWTQQNATFLR